MSIQTTQGQSIEKARVEGKVRIYYLDGTPHDCWPVDAVESVNGGSYFWEPPNTQQVKANDQRELVDEDATSAEAEEAEEEVRPKRTRKAK